jgi:GDP-4-dehydro-6-deoxy-D-mannose reductase
MGANDLLRGHDKGNGRGRFAKAESKLISKPEVRVLITGGDGFVAPFAARAIKHTLSGARVLLTSRQTQMPLVGCESAILDILDKRGVAQILQDYRPTHILHLAGIASRGEAEANPSAAWNVNVSATLNLAENLRLTCAGSSFIFASSNVVYSDDHTGLISESNMIGPRGVYASTKAAADLALGALASDTLRIIRFRPFNHTGPGQTAAYAFGSFAEQIAAIEVGDCEPIMKVGNLSVRRDFLDVRDVANAYAQGIAIAQDLPPDSVFNLASGVPRAIGELLDVMLSYARVRIAKHVNPTLQRGNEIEVIAGDSCAARSILKWNPEIPIEETLLEMVDRARANLHLT